MMDYQRAYKILFNEITDALNELEKASEKFPEIIKAEMILQNAQRQTEDMYIEAETEPILFHAGERSYRESFSSAPGFSSSTFSNSVR